MENQLDHAVSELGHDLSSDWQTLSADVRSRVASLQVSTSEAELAPLKRDVAKLCDHLERLHRDAAELLASLEETPAEADVASTTEFDRAAIRIQRESHEGRADLKDIIKALFMWQDHPAERVREKQ